MRLGKQSIHWIGTGSSAVTFGKQRRDADAKDGGDPVEPAASHPISSLLVFLDLLERHADLFGKRRLRHLPRQAIGPHALPDENVDAFDALWHMTVSSANHVAVDVKSSVFCHRPAGRTYASVGERPILNLYRGAAEPDSLTGRSVRETSCQLSVSKRKKFLGGSRQTRSLCARSNQRNALPGTAFDQFLHQSFQRLGNGIHSRTALPDLGKTQRDRPL